MPGVHADHVILYQAVKWFTDVPCINLSCLLALSHNIKSICGECQHLQQQMVTASYPIQGQPEAVCQPGQIWLDCHSEWPAACLLPIPVLVAGSGQCVSPESSCYHEGPTGLSQRMHQPIATFLPNTDIITNNGVIMG